MALIAVSAIVGAVTLFLAYWIYHNRRIARRHSLRRASRRVAEAPARDFLGRELMFPAPEDVTSAAYIEVHVVEIAGEGEEGAEHKIFRTREAVPE
jgi:hypothetical protein